MLTARFAGATVPTVLACGVVCARPVTSQAAAAAMKQSHRTMAFEQNTGRYDPRVRFVTRSGGVTTFLTDTGATMVLPGKPMGKPSASPMEPTQVKRGPGYAVRMEMVGATKASPSGVRKLPGEVNYFIGNDPRKWRTGVPTYAQARFAGVYPGTDLVYYGNNGRMEYDFVVKPGADPSRIRLAFRGAEKLQMAADGTLVAGTPLGNLRFQRPYAYQTVNGRRVQVACSYDLAPGSRQVAFRTARYDSARPLVVDPSLTFCSYLGGSAGDNLTGVAINSAGTIITCGSTASTNYPTASGPSQHLSGAYDVVLTGLSANGATALFSTYMGGTDTDLANACVVDASDNIYVSGVGSTGFPTTSGAYKTTTTGIAWFVAKLASSGKSITWCTLLGGSASESSCGGLAVKSNGQVVVAGNTNSSNFPGTLGHAQPAYGGSMDMAAAVINSTGTSLVAATYWGGTTADVCNAMGLGPGEDIYLVGRTFGSFPTTAGAYRTTMTGSTGGTVVRLSADLTSCKYATLLDGTTAGGITVANGVLPMSDGSVYVGGSTTSATYPVTAGALLTTPKGGSDGFISRLATNGGSVISSTLIGSSSSDSVNCLATNSDGNIVACGTASNGLTPSPASTCPFAIQTAFGGTDDMMLAVLTPDLATALYLTYFGGVQSEAANTVCQRGTTIAMAGTTRSASGVASSGSFQSAFGGSSGGVGDGLVAVLSMARATCALSVADASSAAGSAVTLTATLTVGAGKIAGRTVNFTVGGAAARSAVTDSNGVARRAYDIAAGTPAGTHTIGAAFAGEAYLAASSGSGTLTINPPATSMSMLDVSGGLLTPITLTAFLSADGAAVPGKSISFTVDDVDVGSGTTDDTGTATVSYTAPSGTPIGDHAIGASFAGDSSYTGSSATGLLTLTTAPTTLTVVDALGVPGTDTTLTALLTTGATPVEGKTITFALFGWVVGSATTDANGLATVQYSMPGNVAAGSYDIYAWFDGDAECDYSDGIGVLSVDTNGTTLTVSAPAELSLSAYGAVSATLVQTSDSSPLAGKAITFDLSGGAVGSATTDSSGKAVLSFLVADSLATGNATVTASFAGSGAYAATSGSATVVLVDGGVVGGYAAPATGKRGDRVRLYCYLYRNVGARDMLVGKAISIRLDGAEIGTATTDQAGCAAINWTIPGSVTPGVHTIAYVFAGDSHYAAWTGQKPLTVSSRVDLFAGSMPDGSPGATVQLYAYLYDKISGEAYAGQTLAFQVDGVTAGAGTTDALGRATLSYTVPLDMPIGDHVITVSFAGSAGLPAASAPGKLVVKAKAVTAMYVRSYPLAVEGSTLPVYCYLYVKQGKVMLAGKQVTISIDGVDVATPTTDSHGYAEYRYTVPAGAGTHLVGISFAGDTENQAISGTGAVVVP